MTKKTRMIEIGKQIKISRNKNKITQKELAKKVGISRPYLSDIENGRYMPSVDILFSIVKELNIDLNFFINIDGNTSS